jgi:hypothetical protein
LLLENRDIDLSEVESTEEDRVEEEITKERAAEERNSGRVTFQEASASQRVKCRLMTEAPEPYRKVCGGEEEDRGEKRGNANTNSTLILLKGSTQQRYERESSVNGDDLLAEGPAVEAEQRIAEQHGRGGYTETQEAVAKESTCEQGHCTDGSEIWSVWKKTGNGCCKHNGYEYQKALVHIFREV